MPLCAKMISSWVSNVLIIAKANMSLGNVQSAEPLLPW